VIDPGAAPAQRPRRHPRQNLILAVAAALLAAVVVIVLVVTLRGSDGPASGSPDAVTDQFAAALRGHDTARMQELTCAPQRGTVAHALADAPTDITSAVRRGSAEVQGEFAVDLIDLRSAAASGSVTVALREVSGTWCVGSVAIALPSH
jgi:hypothetical protein